MKQAHAISEVGESSSGCLWSTASLAARPSSTCGGSQQALLFTGAGHCLLLGQSTACKHFHHLTCSDQEQAAYAARPQLTFHTLSANPFWQPCHPTWREAAAAALMASLRILSLSSCNTGYDHVKRLVKRDS